MVVISFDPDSSREWATPIRRNGLGQLFTRPWGDLDAYRVLLNSPCSLAVFDVPDERPLSVVRDHIKALSLIAPVVVLAAKCRSVDELLNAGAVDALPRHAPAQEISARLRADLRWLATHQVERPERRSLSGPGPADMPRGGSGSRTSQASQAFMLDLLTAQSESGVTFSCHDLRLLLGSAGTPLSRRALRGRVERLSPKLSAMGHRLSRNHQWGQDFFRVEAAS
ncbi:hypothetical protein ACFWP5_41480 [Streptomyces sp. NPDC058469]|uniref:hypothetical protein n=1 Tax=Streptomyces sp. NPDC058469 TaxID=3346514 RepID=UPI0036487CA6